MNQFHHRLSFVSDQGTRETLTHWSFGLNGARILSKSVLGEISIQAF
jgi:hypothetical protein